MYNIYGMTDMGSVRTSNEDGFAVNEVVIAAGDYRADANTDFLTVVCDGMGGESSGDVASAIALKAFARAEGIAGKDDLKRLVEQTVQDDLQRHMDRHPQTKGMGTTAAGVLCRSDRMTIFHIGDSRVYRFRDGFIKPLTKDHSLVETLFDTGQISYQDKRTHPERHVLLRSLGQPQVQVEIQELPHSAEVGDLFLICTDGLTEYVTEDELEALLQEPKPLDQLAQEMVRRAKAGGGADNITVVLIKRAD